MYYMSDEDVRTSKATRIYSWLREEFAAGRIAPGDRMPSENDLCGRFATARPAVRQAIARLTHEGYVETVRGKGSFRLEPKGPLSRDVALVLPSISTYIYPELAEAANRVLRAGGCQTLFDCVGGDLEAERRVLEGLRERRPAGLIISPKQTRLPIGADDHSLEAAGNIELLKDLRAAGMAVLFLDDDLGDASFSSLVIDDEAGGAKAVDYFVAKGHRRISVVWWPSHAPFERRRNGAMNRMAELGLDRGRHAEFRIGKEGRSELATFLADASSAGEFPTAVFCANDHLAFALMETVAGLGLRVPDDISVIGFDDSPAARMPGSALTSFEYPSRWIGERAAALMLEALDGKGPRSRVRISVEPVLRERSSVGAPNPR
jgi:GntR family transcriptional regulator of arabinose operon